MKHKQCCVCGRGFCVPNKPGYVTRKYCLGCSRSIKPEIDRRSRRSPLHASHVKAWRLWRRQAKTECVCADCGASFPSDRKRKRCGLCALVRGGVGLYCTLQRECLTCKTIFRPRQLCAEYCGRLCKDRSSKEYERVLASRRARGVKPRPMAKPATYTTHKHQCNLCSAWFWSARKQRVRCDGCKGVTSLAAAGLLVKNCKTCGASFQPNATHGRVAGFCSSQCRKKKKRVIERRFRRSIGGDSHRKRARRAGVEYEPVSVQKVMDRDGWRCQICGRSTPKKLRGTCKPNAPELDHVVPFAMGGSHTYRNVQCACRECNASKGGTQVVGQMGLFGVAA